jgi:hypothetical protein
MTAIKYIAIWGVVSIAAAIIGGILAGVKRRDHSAWAAWCFVLPPLLIVIALLPKNKGPLPPRRSLDDDDRERELA